MSKPDGGPWVVTSEDGHILSHHSSYYWAKIQANENARKYSAINYVEYQPVRKRKIDEKTKNDLYC